MLTDVHICVLLWSPRLWTSAHAGVLWCTFRLLHSRGHRSNVVQLTFLESTQVYSTTRAISLLLSRRLVCTILDNTPVFFRTVWFCLVLCCGLLYCGVDSTPHRCTSVYLSPALPGPSEKGKLRPACSRRNSQATPVRSATPESLEMAAMEPGLPGRGSKAV